MPMRSSRNYYGESSVKMRILLCKIGHRWKHIALFSNLRLHILNFSKSMKAICNFEYILPFYAWPNAKLFKFSRSIELANVA